MSARLPDETEIAARLAARLCHDFVGPIGGVVSGLDILTGAPGGEMREAAQELIDSGARRLLALIVFARAAYARDGHDVDSASLEALARGIFRDQRPTLEWAVEAPILGADAARGLLILIQIAADALAAGGRARAWARVAPGGVDLAVEAAGPRARLHPEVAAGLAGAPLGEGRGGLWVQAYFLHQMVKKTRGEVSIVTTDANITFKIHIP